MDCHEGLESGLLHYLTPPQGAFAKAIELAHKVAGNAPLSNYAIVSGINKVADMSATEGLFTESLIAAMVQTGEEVQHRLGDFVEKRAEKVAVSCAG